MAIIKTADKKITAHEALSNAIDYITNESKAYRITGINCCGSNTEIAKQFYIARCEHNQDKGIIAHHFIQSFSPDDNITPEQAHKIGNELAEKCFPNYQVVISTHKDKDHIHNHIIVNSVNLKTGYKYHDKKASLETVRLESDEICKRYDFSIIKTDQKGKALDQATYQLAKEGKSWKVSLVNDIDDAISKCKSKIEFIDYLNKRDYKVRYTDSHITITKLGEKKGVRVDTLAKQFGNQYTKVELEKAMGFYLAPPLAAQTVPDVLTEKKIKPSISEWERYEKWYAKNNVAVPLVKTKELPQIAISTFKHNPISFTKRLYLYFALRSGQKKYRNRTKEYIKKKTQIDAPQATTKRIGNVSYKQLTRTAGENYYIKITSLQLAKLIGKPIFYSAKVNMQDGTATVTVKKYDKQTLATILGINDWRTMDKQSANIKNSAVYKSIKSEAIAAGVKPQYLIVTPEQLDELQQHSVPLAFFPKETKFNICFLPEQSKRIEALINIKKNPEQQETEADRNRKLNNELKITAARTGDKLLYKIVPNVVASKIQSTITAAVFQKKEKPGFSNVVYLGKDKEKVQEITNNREKTVN